MKPKSQNLIRHLLSICGSKNHSFPTFVNKIEKTNKLTALRLLDPIESKILQLAILEESFIYIRD